MGPLEWDGRPGWNPAYFLREELVHLAIIQVNVDGSFNLVIVGVIDQTVNGNRSSCSVLILKHSKGKVMVDTGDHIAVSWQ